MSRVGLCFQSTVLVWGGKGGRGKCCWRNLRPWGECVCICTGLYRAACKRLSAHNQPIPVFVVPGQGGGGCWRGWLPSLLLWFRDSLKGHPVVGCCLLFLKVDLRSVTGFLLLTCCICASALSQLQQCCFTHDSTHACLSSCCKPSMAVASTQK